MTRKVAIVIGVQKTKGLIELPGARHGAEQFADWADEDGFEVIRFIDRHNKKITRAAILKSISAVVEARDVTQLYIFFAGHGTSLGMDADFWLLSDGATTVENVVNVGASIRQARNCHIPHIAIFADACRTIASRNQITSTDGAGPIFPSTGIQTSKSRVDQFYGTITGAAALEIPDEDAIKAHGIFTEVLLDALRGRTDKLPTRQNRDTGETVLYAAHLKKHLDEQVPLVSSAPPILVTQTPECRVESQHPYVIATLSPPLQATLTVEATYADGSTPSQVDLSILRFQEGVLTPNVFKHVAGPRFSEPLPMAVNYGVQVASAGYTQSPVSPEPVVYLRTDTRLPVILQHDSTLQSIPDVLGPPPPVVENVILDSLGGQHGIAPADGVFEVVSRDLLTGRTESQFQVLENNSSPRIASTLIADQGAIDQMQEVAGRIGRRSFESKTGLSVYGAPIVAAYVTRGDEGVFPEGDYWSVRGHPGISGSAVLDLGDGRYAAVAMLSEFLGTLIVEQHGVEHLSYLPAPGSQFDVVPDPQFRDRARLALAQAEMAARLGNFQVALDDSSGNSQIVTDDVQVVARTIRSYKHYNPVLGVFAAYAYYRAGNRLQIQSLVEYFRDAKQPVPFDIVLLASIGDQPVYEIYRPGNYAVAPAFPLLTQGWYLLGDASGLPPVIAEARRNLAPSMWTTINGESGRELGLAIARGEL